MIMTKPPTRRQVLGALAAGGVGYGLARSTALSFAQMSGSTSTFTDYKALVCVFLFGGNDSWNMLVPTSESEYGHYFRSRGGGTPSSLAVPREQLLSLSRGDWVSNNVSHGFHPAMSECRQLFNQGRLAVLPNIGPMIRPLAKQDYLQLPPNSKDLPPQLFSHNDQQDQWNSLKGRFLLKSGWGGRIADLIASRTGAQQMPLNVSLFGQTIYQTGDAVDPYVMGIGGAQIFEGLGLQHDEPQRRANVSALLDSVIRSPSAGFYERGYARVQRRAIDFAQLVNGVLSRAPDTAAFASIPKPTPLSIQLRTVSKLIAQRAALGMTRQIFFVGVGGFDNHDRQLDDHPKLLADVSQSIKAFHDATVELGVAERVTLFTQSDFGRTLTSNGDGSDHGWGGIQLVVGGGVRGGRFFGEYPSLATDAPQVLEWGGSVIPTVATDQYAATLARWFGVANESLPAVAPNIVNFSEWDLGFMT